MDAAAPLLTVLARALGREEGEPVAREAAERLLAITRAAAAAWPGVALDPTDLVVYLAERLDGHDSIDDAVARIERLHTSDLLLACAAAKGDRRAIAVFDEQLMAQVRQHVRRICRDGDDVDEVAQILRSRLLVQSGDEKPRILSYGGRGPLGGFLRVVAVRVARDLHRGRAASVRSDAPADDEQAPEGPAPLDPELAVMKAKYGHHFRLALDEALGALPDRERNILAMSVVDGLSTDAIGALYRVNGSTVRRWLTQARERVLADVRERLKVTLNIHSTEFESLMALVRSQIDLNLSQLLVRGR